MPPSKVAETEDVAPTGVADDRTALDVVRRMAAQRAELPVETVGKDLRLLGDLHLSSIAVAQLVTESARALGMAPPIWPTEAANATIAEVAEAKRSAIFERWSGPVGGAWSPRCEIVLHASAESYAATAGKSAAGTGHATVRLSDGKAAERRIDLRTDDDRAIANTLPRELTHVVLADLFPFTPPPKWAEEGMAVHAASPEELDRYLRTCVKCAREGKLFTLAALLEMKDFPAAEKITGFYCGSASLVDYLVRLKGEKHFTTFLRDCQRYGSTSALKRQYEFETPKALQDAWLKSAIK